MNEIYDEESEQNSDNCVVTIQDCQDVARYCIRTFFRDKIDEYGSRIDPEELLTERNISLVLNTSVCDGIPSIYCALKPMTKKKNKGKHPEDVELVLKLLHDLGKLSFSKNTFTGLIAIYIEVCLGYKVEL